MEIEVGDILDTGSGCLWNIVYSKGDVIKIQLGNSNFTHVMKKESALHNVCVAKVWSLKKVTKQLDMSVLDEL